MNEKNRAEHLVLLKNSCHKYLTSNWYFNELKLISSGSLNIKNLHVFLMHLLFPITSKKSFLCDPIHQLMLMKRVLCCCDRIFCMIWSSFCHEWNKSCIFLNEQNHHAFDLLFCINQSIHRLHNVSTVYNPITLIELIWPNAIFSITFK